jgi:transcriptional regulator with XRE-family HTH domain
MIQNRIKEIREAAGMSQDRLAELAGMSQQTISKLEKGKMDLDVKHMAAIAEALGVSPADLLSNAAMAALREEVEPLRNNGFGEVADIVASRDLHLYTVNTDSVSRTGILPGQKIGVAQSPAEVASVSSGDVVLVLIGIAGHEDKFKMLYQYLEPALLVTNRAIGNNLAINLDDPALSIEIIGRVLPRRR